MALAMATKPINIGSAMFARVLGTNIAAGGESLAIPGATEIIGVWCDIVDVVTVRSATKGSITATSAAGTEDGDIYVVYR